MASEIEVFGLEEIKKVLSQLAPKHAANISKAFIHGLASETAKEARNNAPFKTRTLKKAIKAKRRRGKPGQPVSDVVVEHGNNVKNDAFYWRFVEFGTGGKNPQPEDMIQSNLPRIAEEQFTKKLSAAVKREQKKIAKK
jgi:HK97 gp10 family phage protein